MYIINNKYIVFILLLFAASDMTSIAMAGFENCIYCHGTFTSDVPYLNITALNSSIHGRLNNLNNLNYACYACHWDGTPPKIHPIDLSQVKMCQDCHASNLFNAPQVSEHIQNGKDINITTTCVTCHSNSVDTNAGYFNINDRVSHYGTTTKLIQSNNCTFCHYDNSGNSIWGAPNDPRTSGVALNHTPFTASTQCYGCHVSGGGTPPTFHDSSVGLGGNKNCIGCHDIGGAAPKHVDFSATNDNKAVHSTLNANAITSLNSNNLRCWACHGDGDGSENAQPAGGHPLNYKTPKNCNNSNCHSLSQSRYKEPMVYSHFQNASLNGNPNNATNYNITTSVQCQICHINSLVKTDNYPQQALVSHYASKDDLIDSFNCTYCHRVKNNSEVWGNATLIYKNTTSLVELDKERNKLTAYEGQSIYLGDGYSMKVVEISTERSEALIQLFKNNSIVDETSLRVGVPYNYEEYITIDNGTFRTPIIILNLTSIFKGTSQSLIQFSGFRTARVHAETNSTSCLACHLYRYSPKKGRYLVIDRDVKDTPDHDIIYYTNVLVDFIFDNKSKIYYNNDDYVLSQINTNFGRFLTSPTSQKYLTEGETWDIGENVSLKLNGVATDSKQALLALMINNSVVEDWAVTSGSEFNYTRPIRYKGYVDTNVTVFSAKLASIAQANPNFVVLKDVVAISPWIRQTTANTTVFGFNSSWLFPNDTFIVGKVPENFHQPNQYTDQRMWADCVKCHDTSSKLNIPNFDAISSRLGMHDRLNLNASSETILSDSVDKACWACHTPDGLEPNAHIPTYVTPRYCKSCHVYQENPFFGAINISDEPHALEQNCPTCHIQNTHTLIRFEVSPVINKISLSKTQVSRNETIHLVAEAIAGYKFKIRAAEYFLDGIGISGNGTPLKPVDGKFDSQTKNVTSDINTSEIAPGQHTLYIHAMERNNRWGEFSSVNFTIAVDKLDSGKKSANPGLVVLIIGFVAAYLAVSRRAQR
ncbi:Cytochrome c7 c [uncultured archaeon]|nr:Cytochrome c7 c [uncultured archaeon]